MQSTVYKKIDVIVGESTNFTNIKLPMDSVWHKKDGCSVSTVILLTISYFQTDFGHFSYEYIRLEIITKNWCNESTAFDVKLSRELIQHLQYIDNESVNPAECVNAALLSLILTTVKGSQFSTFLFQFIPPSYSCLYKALSVNTHF